MTDTDLYMLPADVRAGLTAARARDRRTTGGRLRVQMGANWYPIAAFDATGFEVPLAAFDDAPALRGLVEIHDGPRMIRSVLAIAVATVGDMMRYDFKRATLPRTRAPLDYESDVPEPAGYLA